MKSGVGGKKTPSPRIPETTILVFKLFLKALKV